MGDDNLKRAAAEAALRFVPEGSVIGVGSGSTVNYFVAAMNRARTPIRGAVPASNATAELLSKVELPLWISIQCSNCPYILTAPMKSMSNWR